MVKTQNVDKWKEFRAAHESSLDIKNINAGGNNITKDFYRASGKPVEHLKDLAAGQATENYTFNGISLNAWRNGNPERYSFEDNNDANKQTVRNFLSDVVLAKFNGGEEKKRLALDYLINTFHQGGFMNIVSAPLALDLILNFSAQPTLKKALIVESTDTGFRVQEFVAVDKLVMVDEPCPFVHFMENDSEGTKYISSKENAPPLIQAQATADVDFSEISPDRKEPQITVESNQIKINHEGISAHYDTRNFLQKIIDFFKDVFHLNDAKAEIKQQPVSKTPASSPNDIEEEKSPGPGP